MAGKHPGTLEFRRGIGPRSEPTYIIRFSKHGCWASRQYDSGQSEEIPVEDAMREFDKIQSENA